MIIIKLIILLMIFCSSTGIGFLISKKYMNRVLELKDFKRAINILETKIKFTYEPIPNIFYNISEVLSKNVSEIFKKSSDYMKQHTAKISWENAIDDLKANLFMNNEDINIIRNLGNLLGQTDTEGQISEIKVTSNFIDIQIKKAEEERKRNEKMYKSLGTIVGLAIVIILI